ncbi:MAG: hypothetical protein Q9199_005151 [Rusavskia elegans]
MPPFTNQFSLSLELTRLVPFGQSASNAIMSLAGSLQNSGSETVIEEDLANIFGRCRTSPHRERGFRKIVGKNHSSTLSSALGLTLEDGPGPTALYLAMVIQSSLLTYIHEKSSLAAAIEQIFERKADEAGSNQLRRAVPSQEGNFGPDLGLELEGLDSCAPNQPWRSVNHPFTLLSVSDNEPLLLLRNEPDEVAIDATYKQPAGGYGRKILEHECPTEAGPEALIHELSLLALAFAAILSQHLYTRPRSAFDDNTPKDSKEAMTEGMSSRGQLSKHEQSNEGLRCQVPRYGLIRSARFLFNEPNLSLELVEGHLLAAQSSQCSIKIHQRILQRKPLGEICLEMCDI